MHTTRPKIDHRLFSNKTPISFILLTYSDVVIQMMTKIDVKRNLRNESSVSHTRASPRDGHIYIYSVAV